MGYQLPEDAKAQWYTFDEAVQAMGISVRKARAILSDVRTSLTRPEHTGRSGRPSVVYHYTTHPLLVSHYREQRDPQLEHEGSDASALVGIAPDDLVSAQLRLLAVTEYEARILSGMLKSEAAAATIADWKRSPRSRQVPATRERLNGNHIRQTERTVTLGEFSPRSLHTWSSIYRRSKSDRFACLRNLAPKRKGKTGRPRKHVADTDVRYLNAISQSAPRSTMQSAIDLGKAQSPGCLDGVSDRTAKRRMVEADPRRDHRAFRSGYSSFRQDVIPDINRDWNRLDYNDRWEIDDVQEDWYAWSMDGKFIVRPYAYVIIRVATRQWISVVTSETPITKEQVNALVGFTMASAQGGIPKHIHFERGTTACDSYLEELLTCLGIGIGRTQMDGGVTNPHGIPDRAKGHPGGKPIVESNFRKHHNLAARMPLEVGTDERNTADQFTETAKKQIISGAKVDGKLIELPTPEQYPKIITAFLDYHNNLAHTGLPKVLDPQTEQPRHMTPNERAMQMVATPVTVMDGRMLPLFSAKGHDVPVSKNGIQINSVCYGRFDEDLKQFQRVTANVSTAYPFVAYIKELGRHIDLYEKDAPVGGTQYSLKAHYEKHARNKHEALMAEAAERDDGRMLPGTIMLTHNPTPARPQIEVTNDNILARAQGIVRGRQAHEAQQAELSDRTRFDSTPARIERSPASRRASALTVGNKYAALSVNQPTGEDEC
jgi:hypothetical protein